MLSINSDWEDFRAVSGGSASCLFKKTQGMGVALSAPSVEAGSKRVLESTSSLAWLKDRESRKRKGRASCPGTSCPN
jgi:hypothetical protein